MGLTGGCVADLDAADGAGVDVNCAGACVDEVCTIIGTSGLSGPS